MQELLNQLTDAYGDQNVALEAARASAVDALLCCNSWYTPSHIDPSEQGDESAGSSLQASHAWSRADVGAYIQTSWCASFKE